ncbi:MULTISPECIES: M48 family metallopeptidase [Cobetia]|jgi:predicted Zn-dependent protease|uniref:M48 family metallopeptidase n=3 Tax=Cobetia TaxID=204286 RepID=A0AAP4TXV6_9GAMM|nr:MULTISPECIES: M48 family metallopeptidase [Cobetia]UTV86057.1 M48 family metallopeptidase [Cobetia litoralis]MBU3009503.1 M48 family metallopeptidase [Cobetia amphilecti]MCK8069467.1 M48 family metallopeptidase [Cobetia sp. 1CM21F]MCO7233604.1 M48 family metallopeptidase [Cobetia sp. Dlab-2-AX]MCO7236924.1 M48 family metallopeptidase [Cobetia sp. Dlab-2-U]|tara:strand:- start:38009 stop:38848 length:840 start_codon:yes stop_codon:yes gene_type:complete
MPGLLDLSSPRALRRLLPLAALAASVTLSACASSPLGRSQLTLYSDQELEKMGEASFSKYQQELPVVEGRQDAYVSCVADAVTAKVPASYGISGWQVKVFEDESANAFALPGGYIGVNTGLLEVAENQDQLATVIGHEIAHVLARHANERVSTQSLTSAGLSLTQALAGLEGTGGDQLMGLLGMGAEYGVLKPFSRSHESEADLLGLDLMAEAGFDPRASIKLWANMNAAGGAQPPVWMSTHPSDEQRMAALNERLETALPTYQQARAAGEKPNCDRLR